jgi:GNAT superfamily N-acetyltransferase
MSLAFVPGTEVPDGDLDRMAGLLFATSHLEYCSVANTLGLPLRQLQRRQNVEPYLRHIRALYDGDRFVGFHNSATIAEYAAVQAPSYYRAEVREMDAAYDAFVAAHARPEDLFVAGLAVEPEMRGKGCSNVLLDDIARLARERAAPRIVLTVWETSAALPIYLRKGFQCLGSFDYAYPLFFERLHALARQMEES